jgi:hypothetical protein
MKERKARLARNVTCLVEKKSAYQVLEGNPEVNTTLRKYRCMFVFT